MDDPVVVSKCQLCASIDGCAWKFPENRHHLPLKENLARVHDNGEDVHVKLLATVGESFTHRGERLNTLDPLDGIFEDDVLVIVREDVRPVGFSFPVVGSGPKFADPINGQRLGDDLVLTFLVDGHGLQ